MAVIRFSILFILVTLIKQKTGLREQTGFFAFRGLCRIVAGGGKNLISGSQTQLLDIPREKTKRPTVRLPFRK